MNYVIYNIRKRARKMERFTVDFYREEDGTKPVGQFIRTLPIRMKAKVIGDLHLLEEYGNLVSDGLTDRRLLIYNYFINR